ncbi:hypothetical protein CKM354_000018700 [Cercospora kikuchii]|uniref:BTB domain-containing protein n=1 Tax=Cercospora kikuchii TaxID=84275 RepID=A0A9P3FBM1_9PEZI|nr:uncharacterized protein CKM354_000018700 [Cercospora kikuchii]GIZ36720.1 hypothetical protein CKM354_000018700 [Cercospora kikuchii]
MADSAAFQNFFKDKEYSDITIKFSGREIPCHKMIICTQSDYFKKLCGTGSRFAEKNQKVVELKEDDPDAVEAVLRYLYFGNYVSGSEKNLNDWKFHVEVTTAASKYLVPKVVPVAVETCMRLLDKLTAAEDVYDAIVYIRTRCAHNETLLQKANALQTKHITKLLMEPRFVNDLSTAEVRKQFDRLRKLVGESFERHSYVCKKCGNTNPAAYCYCTGGGVKVSRAKYFVTIARDP